MKKIVAVLFLALMAIPLMATSNPDYGYLTFTMSDGNETSMSVVGMKIVYHDGDLANASPPNCSQQRAQKPTPLVLTWRRHRRCVTPKLFATTRTQIQTCRGRSCVGPHAWFHPFNNQ